MHEKFLSYVTKLTREFFQHIWRPGMKIMELPLSNPDLNRIENLWSIVKIKLHEDGENSNSKADLVAAIKSTISEIEPTEAKN